MMQEVFKEDFKKTQEDADLTSFGWLSPTVARMGHV